MRNATNLLVVICLLGFGIPVFAQTDQETTPAALSGAYTIDVPTDWTETDCNGSGCFWETQFSEIRVRTYSPQFQNGRDIAGMSDLMGFLVTEVFEARTFDTGSVQSLDFGAYEGYQYTFEEILEGSRYNRTILMYQLDNDFIVVGYMKPLMGHDLAESDVETLVDVLPTVALDDTYLFYEGTTIDLPSDWQLTEDYNAQFASFSLRQEEIDMDIILWPSYGLMAGIEDPSDFLAFVYTAQYSSIEALNRSNMQTTRVAGFDAVFYPFSSTRVNSNGTYDRGVIAFSLPTNGSTFAVEIHSVTPDSDIEAIYSVLDTLQPGTSLVCALFAQPGIRIRTEATTNSEMVRQTDEETLVATHQTVDSSNYTWFYVGEGWIRSDVIFHERNACEGIPFRR